MSVQCDECPNRTKPRLVDAVTDSVTFVVTLPTTPLFVIMPLLERSDVSGTFTLAVQKRNLRVDGTVDDIEIIDPSACVTMLSCRL